MKKRKSGIRRVAALVCSVALLATLLPVQTFAAGDGTSPSVIVNDVDPENGEGTPDPVVSCTKTEDCQADTHEEGCPKYVAPDGEETPDPVVSCTKTEDCQADTHEEGCPKYVAPDGEETPDPVVSCTKTEDCQAETHEEGCPKYVDPDGEETPDPVVSCTKNLDCQADTHEEGCPKYPAPEQENDNENGGQSQKQIEETTPSTEPMPLSVTPTEVTVHDEAELREAIANVGTDDTTITVDGTIELSDAIQINSGKNIVLQGADASAKITFSESLVVPSDETAAKDFAMFTIGGDAGISLTLKNITVDGANKARLFLLEAGNTMTIEDGAILENGYAYKPESASDGNSGGAIRLLENTKLTMKGGEIRNCEATRYGGGIYGWAVGIAIEIDGGTIWNNKGTYAGGIVLLNNSSVYLNGGVITKNIGIGDHGGGVFINGDAHCYLSGDIQIYGNRRINVEDTNITYDIYLNGSADTHFVTLTGPFTGVATICRLNDHTSKRVGSIYVSGTDDYTITQQDADHINTLLSGQYLNLEDNKLVVRQSENTVKAIFNANDGEEAPAAITYTIQKNTAKVLPKNIFTREGYVFKGWNTAANGTGTAYNDGASVTLTEPVTLYAQWTETPELDNSEIQLFGPTTLQSDGLTLSDVSTADTDVLDISGTSVTPNENALGQKAVVRATASDGIYTFPVSFEVTVVPRKLTYKIGEGQPNPGSITYNYTEEHHALADYVTFTWADEPGTKVPLQEGTDIDYTYTVTDSEGQGGGSPQTYDYLPMPVGNYDNVKFNLLNENYTFALTGGGTRNYLEIDVNVQGQNALRAYLASAEPKADLDFVYNGQGVLPVEGTLNAYAENSTSSTPVEIGDFTVNVEGLNDTTFHSEATGIAPGTELTDITGLTLPTEPGTYIITASAANENYYLYKSLVFAINKATVTITATDKTAVVGADLPDLSNPVEGEDYTVTGLVGYDQLTAKPTLAYENAASTDSVATYAITVSGAAVDEQHYNAQIQYVSGTLKVEGLAIIAGANQTWTQGSGKDLVITSNADYDDFKEVTVNGETLAQGQDYTVREGSTIVTIKAAYLESLPAGDYDFAIVSEPGAASTTFTVKAKAAGGSETTGGNGSGSSGTTAPSGSTTPYYTCPACGYHNWTATADGYKCDHCGYVESVKQLSGYGNVKGVYEPKTSAAAAQPAAASASSAAIPQTGDAMPVGLLGGVAIVAAAAFVALLVLRKRKHND